MIPADDATVVTKHAAGLRGGEGRPLSELAAQTPAERADRYPFEEADSELVDAVLKSLTQSENGR